MVLTTSTIFISQLQGTEFTQPSQEVPKYCFLTVVFCHFSNNRLSTRGRIFIARIVNGLSLSGMKTA